MINRFTRSHAILFAIIFVLAPWAAAQNKRLWVLRGSGEITEYDLATFAAKGTVKVPAEAVKTPQSLSVNHIGQMLFAPVVPLPLDEEDAATMSKVWFWDGHTATTLDRDVKRTSAITGSNLAITETAPTPYLSSDGLHLYWFSNEARRLQRDGVDLSTKNTWLAWETGLSGAERTDLASVAFPDCSCPTGGCEETCPYGTVWVPREGVGKFFLLTQFVVGKDQPSYKSSSLYQETAGKWSATQLEPPVQRVLDAGSATAILEAIPDTGCCGSANQSDDQTHVRFEDKILAVFDERNEYKNPDYDVSFYTGSGSLSPDLDMVALTVVATADPNKPIQLAEQGQGDPQESERIRKALLELPAVEIKRIDSKGPQNAIERIAFLPHATLVGWIDNNDLLLVEGSELVIFNIASKSRRNTEIRVEDASRVFLR
jgi:hypothetical protein